jgi:hypothetical protein
MAIGTIKAGDLAACNPAVTWRPDERTRLVLNVEYVAADFAPDSGIPVLQTTLADVDRKNSYQSQLDQSEQDIYRYRLDFDRKVNDRLSLRDKLYYTDFKWDSDGTLINGAFPSRLEGCWWPAPWCSSTTARKLFGNQAEAVLSFKTGSLSHSLVGGFESEPSRRPVHPGRGLPRSRGPRPSRRPHGAAALQHPPARPEGRREQPDPGSLRGGPDRPHLGSSRPRRAPASTSSTTTIR